MKSIKGHKNLFLKNASDADMAMVFDTPLTLYVRTDGSREHFTGKTLKDFLIDEALKSYV